MRVANVLRLHTEPLWRVAERLLPWHKEIAIDQAVKTAMDIAQAGYLSVDAEQHIGFVRLRLSKPGWNGTTTWTVDINHRDHFQGKWCRVPDFMQVHRMKFGLRAEPIHGADPTKPESHLLIECPVINSDPHQRDPHKDHRNMCGFRFYKIFFNSARWLIFFQAIASNSFASNSVRTTIPFLVN